MNLETLKQLDKKYAQVIADELLRRIETDECLRNKLAETSKTLKGCIAYIKSKAKKQAEDNCAVMLDEDVFQLAQHYFIEDSLDYEKTSTPKPLNESQDDEPVKPQKPVKEKVKKVEEKIKKELTLFDFEV